MIDLVEKLEQNKKQRLLASLYALSPAEYRDLMVSLVGGLGISVQSTKEEQGSLIIHGQGEGSYLILASRKEYADPELIVRSLQQEAEASGRLAVFMTMQKLDTGTLNYLEKEKVSYADLDKFLALLQRYGLDEQLLVKEDLKVLEDRGEPCLPSVCKLESLLEEAEERYGKGDLARAMEVLDRALEIKPLNDSLWLKKASYQLEIGRAAEALRSATHAAELRPGDASTWFLIAHIQNRLGDRERELSAYDNVLRISPGHGPALLNKGATLYDMGRFEWAMKLFNEVVQRYPQEPRGWNNRGLVLKALGRPVEAQASFEKASVLDRNYADPLINIARLWEERENLEEAVKAWKDALRLVDSRADIWARLGGCLRETGQEEDALTALDQALHLDPSLEAVRQERDELARKMGKAEVGAAPHEGTSLTSTEAHLPAIVTEAPLQTMEPSAPMEEVKETPKPVESRPPSPVMEASPNNVVQQEVEGEMSSPVPVSSGAPLEQGPDTTAPLAMEREISPSEGKEAVPTKRVEWPFEVRLPPIPEERERRAFLEASLLLAGGESEKALQVTELALKEGMDLELNRLKARALLALGRGHEAAEALKEALRHSPEDARTSLDLEALFHRFGGDGSRLLKGAESCPEARARMALDLLCRNELYELDSMDLKDAPLPARHCQALGHMRQGRYREASKSLKAIISEFPAFPEALNNLGVCMRFMGEYDYDQATHMMELALEVDPHYSDARNNIGCTLFATGRYEEAMEALKAALAEDRRPGHLLNLGNVQMALGDVAGAKESLTTALKMEESADALYMLGAIAEGEKQYRWALSLYQDALEKEPGFREARTGRDRTKALATK